MMELNIKDVNVPVEIDTGSAVTLVPEKEYERMFCYDTST